MHRRFLGVALALALLGCSSGGSSGEVTADAADLAEVPEAADGVTAEFPDAVGDLDAGEEVDAPDEVEPTGDEFVPYSLAPTKKLLGIFGLDDVVFAVGENGRIVRRQGSTWTRMASPTPTDLYCVFGEAVDDVWAAGQDGVVLHYDGTAWSVVDPGVSGLDGIVLRAAWGEEGHLYIVGDKGTILHKAGPQWKKEEGITTYNLYSIWGTSLVDIYVGALGGTILRRIGGAWSSQQVTSGSVALQTIYGLSSSHIWAGGTGGSIVQYETASWTSYLSNDTYERTLMGVWAFGEADVWFIGEAGVLIHSDEDKWNLHDITGYYKNYDFFGLWGHGGDTQEAIAVGEKGAMLRFDGIAWKDEASGPQVDLNDICGTGWDDALSVGGDGLLLRFDGKQWVGLDRVTGADLAGATPFAGGYVAVGSGGTVVRIAGDEPVAETLGEDVDLRGVCGGGDLLAAVGTMGKVFVQEGGEAFAAADSNVFDTLNDCVVDADGTVVAVGDMGRIVVVKDGKGSPVAASTMANLRRIAAAANGDLYAVGDNGLVLRRSGGKWEKLYQEPGLFLYGVLALADQVLAVGWSGTVLTLKDGTVESKSFPAAGVLLQVWGTDAEHLFAVGKKGKMLAKVKN